ncbi:sugar transporter stl1 [Pyrenophora seminiperda CCB06]|uniref:Sugar transporter stl1 n=1 Tax=Pyrenophora seminiperda CCB06 TaxID=1302712 RepID=A0A3M7MD72_9PLEO|nr:sugar transporter stl1 [Pyrenophora seminiperda CCB06]
MGFTGKQLRLAQLLLVVLPAFVLFGYNQSGVGGLLSLRDWNHNFPEIDTVDAYGAEKSRNSTRQGAVVASFTIGALFGALSCSWFAEKFGHRKIIFTAAFLTLVGEILQCTSFHVAQFVVGRLILGWGVGGMSATVPVWQSECSTTSNRGKHVVLDGVFILGGYMLEAWINLGFFEIKHNLPLQWRIPLAIPTLISIVPMVAVFMIPESPRWLCGKSRYEEARVSLSAFEGLDSDDPVISDEINGIELALEETKARAKMSDIFTMGKDRLFYRFSLFRTTDIIFQQGLGMTGEMSRMMSGGALTWKFLSCFIAYFTIDRFGRRKLFMFSGCGMASCMLALAIASSFPKSNYSAQIASAFFIYLFNFFIPIGFSGANFLYCTEVAPTRLRIRMAGISTANHWLWNFVINMVSIAGFPGFTRIHSNIDQVTPVAIETIGWRYYLVFLSVSASIVPIIFFFYPETMGRSLEELEMMFSESGSILSLVRESRKPILGSLMTEHMLEKGGDVTTIEHLE